MAEACEPAGYARNGLAVGGSPVHWPTGPPSGAPSARVEQSRGQWSLSTPTLQGRVTRRRWLESDESAKKSNNKPPA